MGARNEKGQQIMCKIMQTTRNLSKQDAPVITKKNEYRRKWRRRRRRD